MHIKINIVKGVYRGGGEGQCPPQNSELSHFLNLRLKRVKNIKNSLLFIQSTEKILYVD